MKNNPLILKNIVMKNPLVKSLFACVFMGLGISLPLFQSTHGLTWSLVEGQAWICYLLVVIVALLSYFYENIQRDVALKCMYLCCVIFLGIFLYGLYVSPSGLDWMYAQTAINMAEMDFSQKAEYWKVLANAGVSVPQYDTSVFNVLAKGLFEMQMQQIPSSLDRKLCSLLNDFWIYPVGLIFMAVALFYFVAATMMRLKPT